MSAVEVTISGVLYDKYSRTTRPVVLIGEATLTGLGVGGGPIIPPDQGGGDGKPPHIWGGGNEPFPTPPIHLPGDPGWPKPPELPAIPPPGSPPVVLPGTTPVHPMTPPPAIIVDYPGVGKVLVPQPAPSGTPQPKK